MKPPDAVSPPQQLSDHLLLRPAQVATVLGLSRSVIYDLMRTGELPVIHVGRAACIPRHAVEAWVAERADAVEDRRHRRRLR